MDFDIVIQLKQGKMELLQNNYVKLEVDIEIPRKVYKKQSRLFCIPLFIK